MTRVGPADEDPSQVPRGFWIATSSGLVAVWLLSGPLKSLLGWGEQGTGLYLLAATVGVVLAAGAFLTWRGGSRK